MATARPNPVIAPILGWATQLRFPWLVAITATLFVLDLAIPDFVPFADEVLLGLLTIVLASFRRRKRDGISGSDASGSRSA
jgi:hypothetical protein